VATASFVSVPAADSLLLQAQKAIASAVTENNWIIFFINGSLQL
jgi:hypothetical protein